jgi:hypothetical protein
VGWRGGALLLAALAFPAWLIAANATAVGEAAVPRDPPEKQPLLSKDDFLHTYQGDFGNAKLAGCGLFNDSVFDPLLVLWFDDPACFEKVLALKAARNDNRVVVSLTTDYHGRYNKYDLWHEPEKFERFLRDVRSHRNAIGEYFKVSVALSGDGHIDSFLIGEQPGRPDPAAEAHFKRDVAALARVAGDQIDATMECWECRDQRNYMTPGTYQRLGRFIAEVLPDAVHATHLRAGSSSVASWSCDPDVRGPDGVRAGDRPPGSKDYCADAEKEGDDPYRGSKPGFWASCRAEGWCDALYYQFETGRKYTSPQSQPNYTGHDGAMGRWWEVVVRLGDDPWSAKTSGGNRHGWVQVPVIAFEFIYDGYHTAPGGTIGGVPPDEYAIEWCKRALALGGWGCGSASYRRP